MTHPTAQHYVLATAGHVDHGKTALVRALTGTDTDRLPEEKRRGITIDLGFAELRLASPSQPERILGIVDVPGHEDFVKNMVAGVGSVDLALLIVAADDGWMPQTEEHLQILSYLGIRHGAVALTKIDLCRDETAAIHALRQRLNGTFLEAVPIVPTSILSGRGIPELKLALAQVLLDTPAPRDGGKPRLPVDRVFSLKGIGTVVTGTLTGGTLSRNQSLRVLPGGTATRARTLQTRNRDVERAMPGSRVAINLPNFYPADRYHPPSAIASGTVARGNVLSLPELGQASRLLHVRLERSGRLDPTEPAMKSQTRIHLHYGSGAAAGRVRLLDAQSLAPGQHALATVKLETPVAVLVGDRFVLRDWSQQRTLAGGIVLDLPSCTGAKRLSRDHSLLESRSTDPHSAEVFVRTQLRQDGAAARAALGANTAFGRDEFFAAADRLIASHEILPSGELLVDAGLWEKLRIAATAAIDAHHQAHPEQSGLPLTELRSRITAALPRQSANLSPLLAAALADALEHQGFVRTPTTLRRGSHYPRLPPRLEPAAQQIRQQLQQHPYDPPSRNQIAPTDLAQQALRFMIANGEAIDLGPQVVLSANAYQLAIEKIRNHLRTHGPATVAELKELLGSSRRIMVPLLEKLDKEKITVRQGDLRVEGGRFCENHG